MSRANVDVGVSRLDAISRARVLSDAESRALEVLLKKQRTYDRLDANRRKATAGAKPAGTPNPDALAASNASVSVPARSDPCAPGATSHGTGA